jgi:hypothetical protein
MDRSSRTQNIIISILCFLLGVILSYIVATSIAGHSVQNTPIQTPVTVSQGTPATGVIITSDSTNPDQNIATVPSLGITFKYLKYGWSYDEDTHGVNRSIVIPAPTVSDSTISFGNAFSLTIYPKDSGQSLETAITAMLPATVPSGMCLPIRVAPESNDQFYPLDSGISYVRLHEISPNQCPPQFDITSSTSVFFSLSSNPTKFFYVQGTPTETLPLVTADGKPFWETMQFSGISNN